MTQQTAAMIRIREMILQGVLAPGERVFEVELAERIGLSRTPVRQALPALAQEGLLGKAGGRGYAVREFSERERLEALRTRAALEGMAARSVAGRADNGELLETLDALLAEGDALLRDRVFSEPLEMRYAEMNERFHVAIVEAACSPLLRDLIARCNNVPFTSPQSFVFEAMAEEEKVGLLFYAHRQHHAIVDAIRERDGARAEMLFREQGFTQEASTRQHADGVGRSHSPDTAEATG